MEGSLLSRSTFIRLAASTLALAALAAPGAPRFPTAGAQTYVPTDDLDHPRVMYADSTISVNDRCIVRQGKLNPNHLPVYVNGYPIGFC